MLYLCLNIRAQIKSLDVKRSSTPGTYRQYAILSLARPTQFNKIKYVRLAKRAQMQKYMNLPSIYNSFFYIIFYWDYKIFLYKNFHWPLARRTFIQFIYACGQNLIFFIDPF